MGPGHRVGKRPLVRLSAACPSTLRTVITVQVMANALKAKALAVVRYRSQDLLFRVLSDPHTTGEERLSLA